MDEEEATQPATQLVVDPRRLGQGNSGLNDEDLADICCILTPMSAPARKAAAIVYELSPQHTLLNQNNVQIREKDEADKENDEDALELGEVQCDIALRLSSDLKDPVGGFHFGRNPERCDIVLGSKDKAKRISNTHFRIYINEHGSIMLEDHSTNGTAVDGTLLRAKEKENGLDYRHTLNQGATIVLTMTPPEEDYRFLVRIPQRDEDSETAYNVNLTAYFWRVNHARMQNEQRVAAAGGGAKREPVNLFPTPAPATPNTGSLSSVGRVVREWKGGKKYNKIGSIGKGAFAVVYKLTTKFDGMPYAAKELEKRRFMKNGILDQKVDMEMKIMRAIKHPNIVQYIEHIDWDDYLYIIMDYVPGGDLGSLISQHGKLPELDVKTMAGQLLDALKYLHKGGITHRDVKPDNILIHSREPFHVKLTDFGLSKMVDSEETFLRTFCGTLLYCAPEVYSEYREYDDFGKRKPRSTNRKALPPQRYGHAVDVWSLAGVLFYSLCGSPPFPVKHGTSYQELLNRIMTEPLDIRPLQRVNISEQGIRFVRGMLHVRPEHRSTIEDLELSSWFVGGNSMEESMEEDEVDMVGDGLVEPQLEEGASQLSIHNVDEQEINDSEEMDDNISDLTELQQPEIPSSFDTNDGISNENETYEFARARANPTNGRLFGEVNVSNIGSSGVIPLSQLNLPVPSRELYSESPMEPHFTQSDLSENDSYMEGTTQRIQPVPTTSMAPPPPPQTALKHLEVDENANRSSSLLGAESMVGHLNMHSPISVASPSANSPVATTEHDRDATISLRRPREEDPDDDSSWQPRDLPPKRQRISTREIEMEVPPSIFWDPKDRSTHHNNYPRMSTSELQRYNELAKSKGEEFMHGNKTFEQTMQSFRSSRSPSIEPEIRAHSEPVREDVRRNMMKRDERRLSDDRNTEEATKSVNGPPAHDSNLPATAHGSNAPSPGDTTSITSSFPTVQPVVGNDFQPPKRILAKLIATSDSCLPTITMNITESMTSWGRGYNCIIRYSNGQEMRVPKYAFKLLLFKPGFYSTSQDIVSTKAWEPDMGFYIATKASSGIWINDSPLWAKDPQNPNTACRWWGELKHGDFVTVWYDTLHPERFTKFRFECYWGNSKIARQPDEKLAILGDKDFLEELEDACLSQERAILAEKWRREAEEVRVAQEEQQREKLARQAAKQNAASKSFNAQQTPPSMPSPQL